MKIVKISELPLAQSVEGLFTIGVDKLNRSVKVPLEGIDKTMFGMSDEGGIYVIGGQNQASAPFSFAGGYISKAFAWGAKTIGLLCNANGMFSFVGGTACNANGGSEFVYGGWLEANNPYESAFGINNDSHEGTLFTIGCGESANNRKNALEVMRNGDIYILIRGERVLLQDVVMQLAETAADNYGITSQSGISNLQQQDNAAMEEEVNSAYYYYYSGTGTIDDNDNYYDGGGTGTI